MKQIEITYRSKLNELNKLNDRLERAIKALEKKRANAEKLGVADWSNEEHHVWLSTVETTENGFIVNKEDIKKNGAWFDLYSAQRDLEEIKRQLEKAQERFAKTEQEVEKYHEELEAMEDLKAKEELQKLEFEQEQKEWKKDGITLEGRYYGTTPNGQHFSITRNSGYTYRSLHCYTLMIDGEMIFTSGEFWRAYGVIKNS